MTEPMFSVKALGVAVHAWLRRPAENRGPAQPA